MYIISSCLVGIKCRYNGSCTLIPELQEMIKKGQALAVCPEVMAGLPTPRTSCEIQQTDTTKIVTNISGEDLTETFNKGARQTLDICKTKGINKAILQSRSPSCGFGKIYDGNFSGKLIKGNGITADLLKQNGIAIWTEENWHEAQ